MRDFRVWKFVLLSFLVWRILLFLVTFYGQPDYLLKWANWDGGHFLGIAEKSYLPAQTVFLPLYPLLIKFISLFGLSTFISGFLISQICTLLSLYFLYKIAQKEFNDQVAKKSLVAFLCFPTSFFLVSTYSESVFLSLTLGAFYTSLNKKTWLSSALAGLTLVTRITGISVFIAIFLENYLKKDFKLNLKSLTKSKFNRFSFYLLIFTLIYSLINFLTGFTKYELLNSFFNSLSAQILILFIISIIILTFRFLTKNLVWKKLNLLLIFISLLPVTSYIIYLDYQFNSPFGFINNEVLWNRVITLPWETFSLILHSNSYILFSNQTQIIFLDAFIFLITLFLIPISFKKLRFSFSIYFFLSILIPLISGTLISYGRFALVMFPIYLLIGQIKDRIILTIIYITFALLLAFYVNLYITGFWVG